MCNVQNNMQRYRLQIREFLRQPTAQSSVLLVIGRRGSGKTRLVDESLNDRQPYTEWLRKLLPWLDGRNRNSRSIEMRQPRNVNRYLLKVDVDHFFPTKESKVNNSTAATSDDSQDANDSIEKKQADERLYATTDSEVAFHLLSNIVFSITSMIDARPNISAHGRTLRAILGFWRYWLAPNALLLPSMSIVWGIMLLIVGYGLFYWLINFVADFAMGSQYEFGYAYIGSRYVGAFICAYLILRWRDLRAVIKMGAKLYELAHAQETLRTDEKKYSNNAKWTHKWALPTGVILAASAVMLNRPELGLNIPMGKELAAALFGASALSVTVSFIRNKDAKASYGSKNPQWMITLLRRYLYLLHRCGIEPVLVFDELDKLDLPHEDSKNLQTDKLGLFFRGILRIRNTIGTNFKIILIGSESVGNWLYQERRKPESQGPIATLIHREVVLEPMSLTMAGALAESPPKRSWVTLFIDALLPASSGGEQKLEFEPVSGVSTLWLLAQGNFSIFVRELSKIESDKFSPLPVKDNDDKEKSLARLVEDIWSPKEYVDYLGSESTSRYYLTDWHQSWIHTGMLELANTLLTDCLGKEIHTPGYIDRLLQEELDNYFKENDLTYGDPGVYDQRTDNPATALQVGTSKVLIALGKFILFRHLQRENKIQTGANGAVKFKP